MSAPTLPVLRDDALVFPTMVSLAQCLCEEITAAGLPPTCFCGVLPGALVAADYVTPEQGMAWVRLTGGWPYRTSVNAQDNTPSSCLAPLGFSLEVGVLWCAPVSGARGQAPTVEAQFEAVRVQMAGMGAIHRAITCCLPTGRSQVVLGTYTPHGPQGGVVGGWWDVTVDGGLIHG